MDSNMITVEHDKLSTNSTLMPDNLHRNQLLAEPHFVLSDCHRMMGLGMCSQSTITLILSS